jgi:hypothetical protein
LRSEGSGECNVIVYLIKNPKIFDIFRVRVSSVVKPYSPVHIHVGGTVDFKLMDKTEIIQPADSIIWQSSNPSIINVDQYTGKAKAL